MNSNNPKQEKKFDNASVIKSIEKLPDQIEQAWRESRLVKFPEEYTQIKNVCVVGMGGSGLGPEMLLHLYKNKLKVPLIVIHDYNLPQFVNEDSLVILSSYSGTTEEVLNAAKQSIAKKSKVTGITEGNSLGEFLDKSSLPYYKINPINNPSKQPRLGLGYSVTGILGMFHSLGLVEVSEKEEKEVVADTKELNAQFIPSNTSSKNFPKELASKLQGSSVGVIAGEFLSGNAHIFANQLNETSKTFAFYFLLSELNHHLLEGFSKPKDLGDHLKMVLFESDQYSEKIKKRSKITSDIIEKQNVETFTVRFGQDTPLGQAFEALLVSSWVSFYLGELNDVDPVSIPWVDYFKEQLAKD